MKYINKKTQVVIETACVISGGDWEKLEEKPRKKRTTAKPPSKKGGK